MTRAEVVTCASLIDWLSAEHAELPPSTNRVLEFAVGGGSALREIIDGGVAEVLKPLEDPIGHRVLFPAYARASGAAS